MELPKTPPPRSRSYRPSSPAHSPRKILDAILYILKRSGCAWRLRLAAAPGGSVAPRLPYSRKTVYHYFRAAAPEWPLGKDALGTDRERMRVRLDSNPQPSAARGCSKRDSHSVKTTGVGAEERG